MEEAPENSKESSHSAHSNGMNEWKNEWLRCKQWQWQFRGWVCVKQLITEQCSKGQEAL